MKTTLQLILLTICLLGLSGCVVTKAEDTGDITFNNPKADGRLKIFTTKQCIITPNSTQKKESAFGSLILASLAKTAITESFSAINDYAIKKATADSEGKTFTTYNNSFMYESVITRPENKLHKVAISTSLNAGCITILKESDKPIQSSQWLDAFVKKMSVPREHITKIFSDNQVGNAPLFLFQAAIIFYKDFGVYEVQPSILNYMSPLGGSKVKNGKDLAITIEISAPGSADKPALQFSYDFKDINANELFVSEHLSSYGSMFYEMVPYNSELKLMLGKVNAVNNASIINAQFIETVKIKLKDTLSDIENEKCNTQSKDDKCKALIKQEDTLETQIRTAEHELRVINKKGEDLKRGIGDKAKKASPINLKASVTEVGDVNKFWEVVAKFTGGLKDDVKTYATAKYNKITDTYTEEEEITDSNNK